MRGKRRVGRSLINDERINEEMRNTLLREKKISDEEITRIMRVRRKISRMQKDVLCDIDFTGINRKIVNI